MQVSAINPWNQIKQKSLIDLVGSGAANWALCEIGDFRCQIIYYSPVNPIADLCGDCSAAIKEIV